MKIITNNLCVSFTHTQDGYTTKVYAIPYSFWERLQNMFSIKR